MQHDRTAHGDALGRAALATTVTGTLLSQRRYLPYGETRWSSGPFPTDRRFTGQREEVTLGVYDYGARFYSPGLGRFLSADTLVPEAGRSQSLNRYAYTLNNPLRYTDPSGHLPLPTCIIGAIVGTLFTTGTYLMTAEIPTTGDWTEFATNLAIVATAGAIGGALIGTGIGAGAGVAIMASVTGVGTASAAAAVGAAGVGVLTSAEGYMLATRWAGESFDRTDFIIETAGGGVDGAVAGLTGGIGSVASSGFTAAGVSMLEDAAHGRSLNWNRAGIQLGMGLATGFVAEGLSGSFNSASREAAMVADVTTPSSVRGCVNLTPTLFPNALRQQMYRLEGELAQEAGRTLFRDILIDSVPPLLGIAQ